MNQDNATTDRLTLLPFDRDPLEALARRLLHDNLEKLPRLERVTVLLPQAEQAPLLRQQLLQQAEELGHQALLGPRILGWRNWLAEIPLAESTGISEYRRELILVQALHKHRTLFGAANHWALAESLLQLFDEMTLNKVGLPENEQEFQRRVAGAYGPGSHSLGAMEREAQLVHTLWRAWHQELKQRGLLDHNTRYLLQLAASLNQELEHPLYLLAQTASNRAEREWLAALAEKGSVHLLLQGHNNDTAEEPLFHPHAPLRQLLRVLNHEALRCHGSSDYSRMLDTLFAPLNEAPLRQRAINFSSDVATSPLQGRLAVYPANDDEEEARAVELQVRRWLLQGKQRIGIVSDNRRLARRLRALLERANIPLQDAAGWALSTTSAAAILERWLQCIEEDFPHRAMLDLLKSPFFCEPAEREAHLTEVYLLERDIVLHENIGSGLKRYRQNLKYRQRRLPADLAARLNPVDALLERLQLAAQPLQQLLHGRPHDAAALLQQLQQSLKTLGVAAQLSDDEAGMRLLEELQKMEQAAAGERHAMTWLEFHNWLGRSLERYDFRPATPAQPVVLMELAKSLPGRFDALIIASAERDQLPGAAPGTPFFNDAVRHELGLPVADELLALRFYHFRRLLEAAPTFLITHCIQRDGEEVLASPWLELLLAFQRLAYQEKPDDLQLKQLLREEESAVIKRRPLPQQSDMPQPSLPPELVPKRYSASAYQQLMDCPYQFFAARGLGLAPTDAIREALEKSDYGERVHRCLQALHGGVENLPGPFTGNWETKRRDEAITLLEQISDAVFARDLEDNFLHRGWLQRWKQRIPEYIDWQLQRAEQWQVAAVEQQLEQSQTVPGLTLHGRLDRCDSDGTQQAILDYKTGRYADADSVSSGEAVQLPYYALLASSGELPVARVEYLSLDEAKVSGRTVLEGDELEALTHQVGDRLGTLYGEMLTGAKLPAWGAEQKCAYCRFIGVCRREVWLEK